MLFPSMYFFVFFWSFLFVRMMRRSISALCESLFHLGMSAEHLRPVLEGPRVLHSFSRVAESLATVQVTQEVVDGSRLGRITALQKPTGGVRGIVVGDIIRRLVGRAIAQHLGPAVERATSPFQCALFVLRCCQSLRSVLVGHAVQLRFRWGVSAV